MSIAVIKPGLLTTLQDAGRAGFAHLGVGRSGAFDLPALRLANALCGNHRDACVLETTLHGPTLRCDIATIIAVTGAPLPLRVDGAEQSMWAPLRVRAGATITLGAMRAGCRSYLAVRGGFMVAPVLGSRSTDINAGLGPLAGRPLRAGDTLPTATTDPDLVREPQLPAKWRLDSRPWSAGDTSESIRLLPGTHVERLTEQSRKLLFSEEFSVHRDTNRVGLRLTGPALEFDAPIEMVSEGCVPGLLQLPPSGQPIAFGPECPVSGGYPRIGQVAAVDIPRLAQRKPGDALRFAACTLDEALRAMRERERALGILEANIALRLRTA